MDIDRALKETINAIKKEPATILGASLAAIVLSALTFGLLAPFLFTGMGLIFLKIQRNEEVSLNKTGESLFFYRAEILLLLAQGLIIFFTALLGMILIVPGLFVMTVWMYAPFYLAYSGKGIRESLSLSYRAVMKNGFIAHFVIMLCLILVNLVGIKLFFVGAVVTVPLATGFLVYLFESIKDKV